VNNAVATTLSKVMGEEEETASKKSNKSVLSRLSKKSKAPSVSPEKPLPATIAEDEAETKIEKVPTIKEDELNEKEELEEITKPSVEEEVKEVSPAESVVQPETAESVVQPETISPVLESRGVVTEETPKPGFFCFSC
jgi:hypothetical protein